MTDRNVQSRAPKNIVETALISLSALVLLLYVCAFASVSQDIMPASRACGPHLFVLVQNRDLLRGYFHMYYTVVK